jgi:hypothetical protein
VFDDAGHLLADAGIKIWATMLVPMGPQHPDWQLHVDALQADVAGCVRQRGGISIRL